MGLLRILTSNCFTKLMLLCQGESQADASLRRRIFELAGGVRIVYGLVVKDPDIQLKHFREPAVDKNIQHPSFEVEVEVKRGMRRRMDF